LSSAGAEEYWIWPITHITTAAAMKAWPMYQNGRRRLWRLIGVC
jgi:hypothetical protein